MCTPRKTTIELTVNGRSVLYDSLTDTVTYFTKNGVCIEAEVPKDFALTRIFQFMDSLIHADLI